MIGFKPCLEDRAVAEITALNAERQRRANRKLASFFPVHERAEETWRIELRQAQPIYSAFTVDQRRGRAIADARVIADWIFAPPRSGLALIRCKRGTCRFVHCNFTFPCAYLSSTRCVMADLFKPNRLSMGAKRSRQELV